MGELSCAQVAGMNIHYKYYPLEYFLDSMVNMQIQNIELWGGSPHFYVEDFSFSAIKKIRKDITSRNLNLVCFTPEQCIYPVNIAAREVYIRERSIGYFEKCLEAAAELNAPMMLITSGWGYLSETTSEAWKRSVEALRHLVEYAGTLEILLVLEPLRNDESNLVNTLASLKQMMGEIHSPLMKGMIDTIPMALAGEIIDDYFKTLGSDLIHIHFIDGKPRGHLAWGDGILPLFDYIRILNENHYNGYLTLEITDMGYFLEPDKAVQKSLTKLAYYMK
jgi:protein FrlC